MKYIFLTAILGLFLTGCSINTLQKTEPTVTSDDIEVNINTKDKLDLSGQGLEQVSQSVFKQTNLKELNVSNNKLTGALPAEIRHLGKLQILDASNNRMTGVPAEVGQLNNLLKLDLSNNQLTGLPYEMGNLKNLKILNLSGNQISKQDLDIIRQKLPASVNIIEDAENKVSEINFTYHGELTDVSGGQSSGLAQANFSDGTYNLLAEFNNLPEPQDSYFYEGWVVRKAPLSVISTGQIILEDGSYVNNYSTSKDLTDHNFYVLTIEPNDGDPAPAEHILEGFLK